MSHNFAMGKNTYTIQQLEEASGISRRTIRFYITRGLLRPPEGAKRGSYYVEEHLAVLKEIRRLVNEGYPLMQIKAILVHDSETFDVSKGLVDSAKSKPETSADLADSSDSEESKNFPERTVKECFHLAPGIELLMAPGRLDGYTLSRIQALIQSSLSTNKE